MFNLFKRQEPKQMPADDSWRNDLLHLLLERNQTHNERVNPLDISGLIKRAHANAESKGWHVDYKHILRELKDSPNSTWIWSDYYRTAKIALIMSEGAEAIEAIRKGESEAEELADIVIRIADYCGEFGIDLEEAIQAKMMINETRPYKHGKAL